MLNENDVVRHLCAHLQTRGYEIESTCTTSDSGVDIVARRGDERLLIEAKGATSSKASTARYGKPFNASQVLDHVANAVYTALRLSEAKRDGERVALAFPRDAAHQLRVQKVGTSLSRLEIDVYWVADDGGVSQE